MAAISLALHKGIQFSRRQGQVLPVPWSEPTDQQDAEYDLHLNNGRLLEHFHEGNMTYRTEGIREKTPCTFVEVSPELAASAASRPAAGCS
jgi:formate dehydrogenase major subunit